MEFTEPSVPGCNDYTWHRITDHADELSRLLQVLRETLERRFCPDEVVEQKLDGMEVEISLLKSTIKRRT